MERSIFAILVCHLATLVFGKHVPVIGWANTRALANTPTIPAGHFVNTVSLQKDYLDRIISAGPNNICVFIIDKLSIDDITKYSDAYNQDSTGSALTNLRAALESSKSSLILPSADSSDLSAYLSSKVNGHVIETSEPSISEQPLDNGKTNVIIVQLTLPSSNDRESEIRYADRMMAAITSQLESMSAPYTALLTAQQSTFKEQLHVDNIQMSINTGRQILESEDEESGDDFVFANYTHVDCQVFFFSKNVTLRMKDESTVALPVKKWDTIGSSCSGNTVNLVMSPSNITNNSLISSFRFDITITVDSLDFWTASPAKISIKFNNESEDISQYIDMSFVITPIIFSYHCVVSEAKATNFTDDDDLQIKSVTFNDLQLQPFDIKDDKFSFPNDCIGFFTEGIWMGLVTALIILIILAFGFGMLANLSVMDKFDDPKGKTITIPQTAE
ncbi:V-type proton ATPase subunit S1-like isoform X2 [Anneissia japonica]|uniref:V-type proton ATPase subunit S1-like isoform X1 n=1 Tax=Anneissia japonica TaxID=1529436 RepID=UPI0014258A28|nr:V-type proton ATPase subunit S1-like isoform X1 [Anneissia japonica]XP_033103042.1 V-type proton ATPase subunit S1-like isoform X2 [Anneissia japonica]